MKNSHFYQQFLINREHRFIYCYVPKVACSSLKLWFMRVAGMDVHDATADIHPRLDANFSLETLPRQEADELLRSSDYYRFAFMRNPFARLVSAYLDKIVNGEEPGLVAIKQFQKGRPWQLRKRLRYQWRKMKTGSGMDCQQGMTFREFVHLVASQSPQQLDPHWRPQTLILGDVPMDFVGRMEHMTEDFTYVCQQLGLKNDLQITNRSRKRAEDGPSECCADWTTAQLQRLDAYPPFERFYTPELTEIFLRVYQQDLTAYEQLSKEPRCRHDVADRAGAA
jgi:dermatan 4-sulfotransferase 1